MAVGISKTAYELDNSNVEDLTRIAISRGGAFDEKTTEVLTTVLKDFAADIINIYDEIGPV